MSEKIFAYDLNNTSIVTVVAIGITTLVLAYVTLTDKTSESSGQSSILSNAVQYSTPGYNQMPFYQGGGITKRTKRQNIHTKRKKLK
jgi:hypothetical protein